ncbi:hypothetical protein V8C35DRAFT_39149 [Trichoderma chlorosporum]
MMLKETQEWEELKATQLRLLEAVSRGREINYPKTSPPDLAQYDFLLHEVESLLWSIPYKREFNENAIRQFKDKVNELFEDIHPVLLRNVSGCPPVSDNQKSIDLPTRSKKNKNKRANADTASPEALSLSEVKLTMQSIETFKTHLPAIFDPHIYRPIVPLRKPKLNTEAATKT